MPITDNFDSYSDGDLNGQGSWASNTAFDVQGSVVQAGAKAVQHVTAASGVITKSGTAALTGIQTVWGRTSDVTTDEMWQFRLGDAGSASRIIVKTNGGNVQYFDGTVYQTLGAVSVDTWFEIDIDWKTSDSTARYSLNGGSYTAYTTVNGTIDASGIDRAVLVKGTASAGNSYWDSLSDGNVVATTARSRMLMGIG